MPPVDPSAIESVVVQAPRKLAISRGSVVPTLSFLERIEEATRRGQSVWIDLAHCEEISRSAALLLTAQIERSMIRNPDCLNGVNPKGIEACDRLHAMGFYEHLKFNKPERFDGSPTVDAMTVCSGTTMTPDLSRRLETVASVAGPLFGSDEFVDQIHEALSEAMTNVRGHAYLMDVRGIPRSSLDHELARPPNLFRDVDMPLELQRWWFAGHADFHQNDLTLCALDHGRTIPVLAYFKMSDVLAEYWRKNPRNPRRRGRPPLDAETLEAVARARRQGIGTGRRGHGFPNMIGLVEHRAQTGSVTVLSGAALYEFELRGPHSAKIERSFALNKRFNGTLIEWKIAGDRRKGEE